MVKYMTEITEADRTWINGAAKELGWKASQVVQLAVTKLKEDKWEDIKKELEQKKAADELADIRTQKEQLTIREKALHAQLEEGGFIRL